ITFFKVLEPFQVCGKSVKTTFISYHPNQYLSIGFFEKNKGSMSLNLLPFFFNYLASIKP
ncbi:hypothetical protein, partial [Streptococcus salivarius]|uniref:hypothetical protein n=1 Tax=Streptococcus salivarius TaxID=1304 RepID=UPI001C2DFEA3